MFKEIKIKPAKKGYVVIVDDDEVHVARSAHGIREIFYEIEQRCRDEDLKQLKKKKSKKVKV